MSTLVTGIGLLVTNDPSFGPLTGELKSAAVVIDGEGLVAWVGDASGAPDADDRIDVAGRCVIPGFVDSHSHLMFAGDRSAEFESRMAGRAYEAGGIRSTVGLTRQAADDEFYRSLGNPAQDES